MSDIVVAVSGGFDPIHKGHVRLLKQARMLGDRLVVILNNDKWLAKKKGKCFQDEDERCEILRSMIYVNDVVITEHEPDDPDGSVCRELEFIKPDVFCNGGDRKADNIPEYKLCEDLGIKMVFGIGGDKVQSSSDLIKEAQK